MKPSRYPVTLVMGGCRSGKSRYALDAASRVPGAEKVFVATSVPTDPDMDQRVARHRAERGAAWRTVEEPVYLHTVIEKNGGTAPVILVDCLTLWVSNLMVQKYDEPKVKEAVDQLIHSFSGCRCPIFLVSNEVGYGIVPDNALARQFRDLAGLVNQRVAAAADRVVLTVAGIDLQIKPQPPFPGAGPA
jgi:adenosylcobinamide kinase/adenosylcobinamide-phosphate guanylyltransferase